MEDDGQDEELVIQVVPPKLYLNASLAPNSVTTGYGSMPGDSATTAGPSGYESYPIGGASSSSLGYQPGGASNFSVGYRPTMSGGDDCSKYTPDMMSGMSCAALPDDYLRCTQAPSLAPDSNTSADMFYNGLDSLQAENKIDLAPFLSHSGMSALQNNKLSVDLPELNTDTQSASPPHVIPSAMSEKQDDNKKLFVDIAHPGGDNHMMSSSTAAGFNPVQYAPCDVRNRQPMVTAPPSDILDRFSSDYVTPQQYSAGAMMSGIPQDNISSGPVALDEILEQGELSSDAEENPENSSGDSGYVGRNNVQKTPINSGNQEQQGSNSSNPKLV